MKEFQVMDMDKIGITVKEFENGAGNYSTAIVELENGEIRNIPVVLVKFVK